MQNELLVTWFFCSPITFGNHRWSMEFAVTLMSDPIDDASWPTRITIKRACRDACVRACVVYRKREAKGTAICRARESSSRECNGLYLALPHPILSLSFSLPRLLLSMRSFSKNYSPRAREFRSPAQRVSYVTEHGALLWGISV